MCGNNTLRFKTYNKPKFVTVAIHSLIISLTLFIAFKKLHKIKQFRYKTWINCVFSENFEQRFTFISLGQIKRGEFYLSGDSAQLIKEINCL